MSHRAFMFALLLSSSALGAPIISTNVGDLTLTAGGTLSQAVSANVLADWSLRDAGFATNSLSCAVGRTSTNLPAGVRVTTATGLSSTVTWVPQFTHTQLGKHCLVLLACTPGNTAGRAMLVPKPPLPFSDCLLNDLPAWCAIVWKPDSYAPGSAPWAPCSAVRAKRPERDAKAEEPFALVSERAEKAPGRL
jgi:hypothetical protein